MKPGRKLEYSDYAAIPDDGKRYEVLEGSLFVCPAPSPFHQRVSKRLQRQLEAYFEDGAMGEVFNAPIDLILSRHDIVQPDILVVARADQISKRGIEGAPLLAVEVLSPSTRDHDRTRKSRRYAALGLVHYWIVDPEAHRIECYRAGAWKYDLVAEAEGPATLRHPDWTDLVIDLAALWR
jgi:Uma2 family endonuclease